MKSKVITSGMTFGRWETIEKGSPSKHGAERWVCRCECRNIGIVEKQSLLQGKSKSCGCLQKDIARKNQANKGHEKSIVDGVKMSYFRDKPTKRNTSGYLGVFPYYTKSGKTKYGARIDVLGKAYTKYGFDTPEDAYINGRLKLEEEHLPKKPN